MRFISLVPMFALFAFSGFVRAAVPNVTLTYAEMFDFTCSKLTGYTIDPQWVEELESRLPELQSKWDESGMELLEAVETVVGKPFKESEFAASLSVCSFPSMSEPLLINMRYSLASFVSNPLPVDVSIGIIFHEILHHYLKSKISSESLLLKKYSNEDETVLSHLHLFALQKSIYLKLNQSDILQALIKRDESLPNKSYARAWEIVNDREDFQDFVKEL